MTDDELIQEFLNKMYRQDYMHDPDPFLTIAGLVMEYYVDRRRKELEENPEVGAESFKGVVDGA